MCHRDDVGVGGGTVTLAQWVLPTAFDYFEGELVSGGNGKIAMWLLDTDCDDRSLFPRHVFLPMAGAKDGWNKLRRDIKAELNEDLLPKFPRHGVVAFRGG
jgi:adenine-specific DNA-methyltransferase